MAKSFLAGQNKQKKDSGKKMPWKKIGLGLGVLVAAFGLGVVVFLLQHGTLQPEGGGPPIEQSDVPVADQKPKGALEESIALAEKGDYQGSQKRLEQEQAASDDDERDQELLIQQSVNAYNAGKFNESLAYAREAVGLINNYKANHIAAQAAEAAGDFAAAEEYYRTTLKKLDKNIPTYEPRKQDLQDAIKRVSQ